MTKYPIHPDFKKYEKIKIPINRLLLPLMNRINNYIFNQRSLNKDVRESRKTIPGYQNAPIEVILYEPEDVTGPLPCLIYFYDYAIEGNNKIVEKSVIRCIAALRKAFYRSSS